MIALFVVLMGSIVLAIAWAEPIAAHTELESSKPSDGEIVGEPISQISLTFTRPVEPASDGMTAFDVGGIEHEPVAIDSVDGQTWIMRYEAPLPDGRFEVYWRVVSADGHIIEGAFAFTVAIPELEPTVSPSPGASSDVDTTRPVPSSTAAPAEPTVSEGPAPSSSFAFSQRSNTAATGSQRIAEATRILIFAATLGIVGGLAFMAFVVRGEPLDSDRVRKWVGASGIVLAVGAAVASLNRAVVIEREWSAFWSPDAVSDAVSTHFGVAAGLRLLGGLALAIALLRAASNPPRTPTAVTALMAGALVVASFAFDGHTVTEGPRWLHAIASATHVSAAAVWSGGVVLLADLLWRRHRRGADVIRPLLRFSRMAATALVLAGAAGTVMAILILDRFADLWSTPWGRLLLAKIALVAVAAAIGGHNRWVLIPAAERHGEPAVHKRLRRAAVIEAIALLCVAVITAFLVAASAV